MLCNVAPKALVAIHIEGPAVCDGLMHAIPKLPSLVSVTLDCGEFARGVSDVGISSLADSPTITNLTNLALTRSSISETGVNSLRRLTSLVCLNLSGSSKLSDLGIKSLTKLRKLKCMLLLDTARITQRGLVECGTPSFSFLHLPLLILHSHNESTDLVITIKSFTLDIHKQRNRHICARARVLAPGTARALPGACVYWSGDSKSASTASECLVMHAVDTCAPTPQPNAATRRDAHAALSAAADATTDAGRCVRPTIELCVSATPGKGLANLSVRTLEAATPATRALDPQSRRSIARMLRLLSAPVSELAQKRSIQDDRWGGGGRRGGMLQGEGDHHEDASRVTVARMRSLAGGGGGSARGAAVLAGRFGTLTNMALLARGPAKKKLKTNT